MNDPLLLRRMLRLLLLGLLAWAPGCAQPKPPHSSLISQHRLEILCTPPPPGMYCAAESFHGYYGTCWRPWPHGWVPCVEPCSMCGTAVPEKLPEGEFMAPPHTIQVLDGPGAGAAGPPPPWRGESFDVRPPDGAGLPPTRVPHAGM